MTIWQAVMVTLGCAALIGIVKFLSTWVKQQWPQWRRRRSEKTDARRTARKRVNRERVRQQRIADAATDGKLIAVGRRGSRPAEVTFSDGTVSYYFCGDWEAYRAALRSGQYDPTRTLITCAPSIE
jgi:hypothetical protein